ncbi:LAETG motif-containing sortase-dependent surface protein [Streptomyces tsukubensis]|uniref:LPXTG cell wall anchor domain-containing protein n=1 Tax=Streptomyces tsukubensis TaxID=83656 RepID=A0A1V4AD56_9ACTN|nr:LAETG motif-containing sortase-dependent surface protein [Streptomyces tsukubensis]OON81452.1 hypothetical protein B1H18_09085 [Streptomyces tsukubensis]QFR95419.1 LPXTG cell wall anchor domain-containing protein [Streptomyces tsukubensis]
MSVTRRSLYTAAAAGALLGALWFVPSANATPDRTPHATVLAHTAADASDTGTGDASEPASGADLADTGGVDTTPYLAGGAASLGIGAGFVFYARRARGGASTA